MQINKIPQNIWLLVGLYGPGKIAGRRNFPILRGSVPYWPDILHALILGQPLYAGLVELRTIPKKRPWKLEL